MKGSGVPMVVIVSVKRLEQMDRARHRFFRNMFKISDCFTREDPEELDSTLAEATRAAKRLENSGGG